MGVTITRLPDDEQERWNEYVAQSRHGNLFHQYEALTVLEEHANATLHPMVGFVGEEPIGLFPIFETSKGPITLAFSPPPRLRVTYLGPASLNVDKLTRRKRESRHKQFIDCCLEWIEDELNPKYASVRTDYRYDDHRPFKWNGFDVTPSYTYVVDLRGGEEDVFRRFSGSTRRYIRKHEGDAYEIEEGGREAIESIVTLVRDRFEAQGGDTPLRTDFVEDLYDRLPAGQIRPYVFIYDDEIITGTILLEYADSVHRWQGGVKHEANLPANELLEWHAMREAIDRDRNCYEIVDANYHRLNRWKSKFGPGLATYHNLKRAAPGLNTAARIYERMNDRKRGFT